MEKEIEETKQYLHNLRNQIEKTKEKIIKLSLLNQYKEMAKVLEELPHLKAVLPSVILEKFDYTWLETNITAPLFRRRHSPSDTFLYYPITKYIHGGYHYRRPSFAN